VIGLHMNYLIYPGASILGGRILRPVKIKEGKISRCTFHYTSYAVLLTDSILRFLLQIKNVRALQ